MFTFTGEIDKVEKPFNDSLLEKVSFKNSESNFYSFKGSLNEIDLQQSSTFMVVPFYIGKSLEKEPIRGYLLSSRDKNQNDNNEEGFQTIQTDVTMMRFGKCGCVPCIIFKENNIVHYKVIQNNESMILIPLFAFADGPNPLAENYFTFWKL
ncbi:MAG: hypothetical protein V3V14_01360 [Saprospiraceae bacterium]